MYLAGVQGFILSIGIINSPVMLMYNLGLPKFASSGNAVVFIPND